MARFEINDCAQAALGAYPGFIREYFKLPPDRLVVCGISFGYGDSAHPANRFRTARAPVDAVVRRVYVYGQSS